jgi:hypothetical protein
MGDAGSCVKYLEAYYDSSLVTGELAAQREVARAH